MSRTDTSVGNTWSMWTVHKAIQELIPWMPEVDHHKTQTEKTISQSLSAKQK